MAKATFRIPEPLLDELRRRSEQEGQSLNTVAVETLWRGLGEEPVSVSLIDMLGPLISQPASRRYNDDEAMQLLSALSGDARHLADALEQTRYERICPFPSATHL